MDRTFGKSGDYQRGWERNHWARSQDEWESWGYWVGGQVHRDLRQGGSEEEAGVAAVQVECVSGGGWQEASWVMKDPVYLSC